MRGWQLLFCGIFKMRTSAIIFVTKNMKAMRRPFFSLLGAMFAIIEPAMPYMLICTLAIFYDCYTAWQLDRRVRAKYGSDAPKHTGKFKSSHFGRVILTLVKVYALIILAYFIQLYITIGMPIDMTKVAAGAVCFWQIWSILENESSCNNATWARLAQRILVDKTERHLGVDLSELKKARDNELEGV